MNESWWVRPDQLDKDQQKVVALPPDQNHLIIGPPGSGKTNLLLLRAAYARRSGKPNILIVVFTRTLQEFMRGGAHNYGLSPDQISNLTAWLFGFVRENGEEPETGKNFPELRKNLMRQASEIVQRLNLQGVYDVIILDEAQDYTPEEIKLFKRLGKTLFAAADSEQKIYATPDPLAELKAAVGHVHPLRYHYRNGWEICKLADEIAKPLGTREPLFPRSNYPEKDNPSRYEVVDCTDVTDAVRKAIDTLRVQLDAYPDEMLGVVCPDNVTLREVGQQLKASPLASICVYQDRNEGYLPITKDTRICISTIHSAKGLEFRTLHLIGLHRLARTGRSFTRNTTYTAVTRAKTALSPYPCGKMPDFLASAISALQKPPPPPALGDLFQPSHVDE